MCKAFYYKKYDFNNQTGVLTLSYALSDNINISHTFTEKITFPNFPIFLTPAHQSVLDRIFFLTHIAFGISYYKTYCPEKLIIESGILTKQQALFFNRFYLSGLGEFAIRNRLNLQKKIRFPFRKTAPDQFPDIHLAPQFLVPVGGGKDSCVSLTVLQHIHRPCCAISVGNPQPIQECTAISQLPHIVIDREIDPYLIQLNQSGTVLNGHVPITGMLAFVLWAAAVIYNYKYVALSCERSANSGNLMQGSLEINHQYSKSFAFECDFAQLTNPITPRFQYFSLLRPLSEYHIALLFARLCQPYFPVFTSCNKAFKLDENQRLNHWCGNCDKCRFVFLILAPHLPKKTLIQIMGMNPLNDETQLNGYKELLGLSGHKPFECVGEFDESRLSFALLLQNPEWKNDFIIRALTPILDRYPYKKILRKLTTPSRNHLIPREILCDVLGQF